MTRFADVLQEIWGDPWFVALSSEAKALYLWGISSPHSHVGGLFVVARPLIELETGLKGRKLDVALQAVSPNMKYDEPTGAVWVRGRVARMRTKTRNTGMACVAAALSYPHLPFVAEFYDRYSDAAWMVKHDDVVEGLAKVRARLVEVHPNHSGNSFVEPNGEGFTGTFAKVPSLSLSPAVEEGPPTPVASAPARAPEPPKRPDGLSGYLVPVADALRRVAGSKPGAIQPTDASVAKSLQDFPRKDFVPLVGDFEHYWLHGGGQGTVRKDIVATWRNWLARQPDVTQKTSATGTTSPVRDLDAERERRLAEAEL